MCVSHAGETMEISDTESILMGTVVLLGII
jgi:hypothetical protein